MPDPERDAVDEHVEVRVADLDRVPVQVAVSALPTVFTLIRDTFQQGRRGTPAAIRNGLLSHLRARDVAAFSPLVHASGWPSLLDGVRGPRETLDDAADRLSSMSGAALLEALGADTDVQISEWTAVQRDPDRWIRRYVDVLHRGWFELKPLWRRSATLLEREVERVEAALDRGVPPSQLLNEVSPRTSIHGDVLRLGPASPEQVRKRVDVSPHGVTLIPVVASPLAGTLSTPGYALQAGAYPLREVWAAFADEAPPVASIEALIGQPRAALLEQLDAPRTAGELADLLHLAPSGVTFHLRNLEAAGLIARVRHGRNVIVHRTARGTQLLALYERP
jgi:DNA-binding transcriptional ArsR family regulator